jgi:hypothetical protein
MDKFYFGEMNPQPLEKVGFFNFIFQNSKWIIMVSNDARFCILFFSVQNLERLGHLETFC